MKTSALSISQALGALLAVGASSLCADTLTIEGDLKVQQTHVGAPTIPILETLGDHVKLRGYSITDSGQVTPGGGVIYRAHDVSDIKWVGSISTSNSSQRKFYIYLGNESSLLWGYFDVVLTSNTWSGPVGNMQGALQKRFAITYNLWNNIPKDFYMNQSSQVIAATGGIGKGAVIGEPEKDPVTGAVRIPVYIKSGGRGWIAVSLRGMTEQNRTFGPGYPHLSPTEDYTPEIVVDNAVQMDKLSVSGDLNVGGVLRVPSITLPDGSSLSTAKTSTLYDSDGLAVVSVDVGGKVNFINGISVGVDSQATASAVAALGDGTQASGYSAIAMGNSTTASGDSSTAMGRYTSASGYYATAMGSGTLATGSSAIAMGDSTYAAGYAAISIGQETQATGFAAMAMGAGSLAAGDVSTAMGHGTQASGYASMALGRFNVAQGDPTTWVATDDLLVIGNGVYNAKSNAFVVHKNGNTRAAGIVESKGGFRTPPMGDLDMGAFTAGANPAPHSTAPEPGLGAGLRYPGE